MEIIHVDNLNVYYGKNHVLCDLNFDFKENAITSIIGPSGCGKSTFLKNINKSIYLEKNVKVDGNILYKGENIVKLKDEILKKNVSLISQMPIVFPFSIYKNLSFVLKYFNRFTKDVLDEKIVEVLKTVKLYDEIKENLNKDARSLSGGQQQRLAIARNLLTEPEVLLLDEPCSALDITNQLHIEDLLISLKEKLTIIIVTHNIKEAIRLSDDCIFMKDGCIVETGKSIFDKPKKDDTKKFLNFL